MKKETPILFSTVMIMAILANRKTQTRRIIKPQPPEETDIGIGEFHTVLKGYQPGPLVFGAMSDDDEYLVKCPYGEPGDLLWVKETYYAFGKWVKNGVTKTGRQKYKFLDATKNNNLKYEYADTITKTVNSHGISTKKDGELRWYKRPSLFMPKEAARIWLEKEQVIVERVRDISNADAIAEGVWLDKSVFPNLYTVFGMPHWGTAKECYQDLWEIINGRESWQANPWVWVVSFKVLSTVGKPDFAKEALAL